MDIDLFHSRKDGTAEPKPQKVMNIARLETTVEADDGQQFRLIVLDADDSFDLVIQYPNDQREIVWSLIRERLGQ
jgi:hypothetical protein